MTGPVEDEELRRLRTEVEDLRSRLEGTGSAPIRSHRARRLGAIVLVVLAALTVPAAATAVWARRTVVNEDAFVATVGPLPRHPAVQLALTDYLTAQVMTAVDVEELVTRTLSERGRPLVAPLTSAVEGFVREKVGDVVGSERFAALWEAAARRAQRGALAVLRGESANVRTRDGAVILDLVPAINAVLAAIDQASPQVLGRDITLPDVTAAELPDEARRRIEVALGRPLPEDFGSLEVFRSDELGAAQDAVQQVQRALVVLVIAALASVAGAVALSPARRRTALQLAVGIGVGVVLVRRLALRLQAEVLDLVAAPIDRDAVEVVSDRVLSGLLALTSAVLVVCVVVAAVALLIGPSRHAVRLRQGVTSLARRGRGALGASTPPG